MHGAGRRHYLAGHDRLEAFVHQLEAGKRPRDRYASANFGTSCARRKHSDMAGWQADISNARVNRSFHVDIRQALALLYAILNKH